MGKKVSGNFEDKNRIREWADVGKSPAEISDLLGIEASYIEAFLGVDKPKPKRKPKKTEVTEEVNDVEYPE